MLNSIINKFKKKNQQGLLKTLFTILAFIRLPLSELHRHEALNILGIDDFTRKYHYLNFSDDFERQLKAFSVNKLQPPSQKTKVAVCLSGDIRSFKYCIPQLKRFLSGYDVTFFCHGWKSDFDHTQIVELDNVYTVIDGRPDFSNLERSSIQAFGFKAFGNNLKIPFLSTNIFPMWYGVERAIHSIEEHEFNLNDFDLICRCRYDNYFLGQLAQLNAIPESNEVIVDPNYDGYGGYGDQFAIGSPATMIKYCTLFDWLPKSFIQYKGDNRFFPEVILKKYLENECDIKVRQIDFGLRLLRNEFIGLDGHNIPLRSHLVSKERNLNISNYIKNKFPDLYNVED